MTEALVIAAPACALATGAATWLARTPRQADRLHVAGAILVAALTLVLAGIALADPASPERGAWWMLDAAGGVFLAVIAVVGLLSALVAPSHLATSGRGFVGAARARAMYYAAYHAFWAALIAVPLVDNLGIAWLLVEATTGASALLVAYSGTRGALEAGWKYLVLTTFGLAVAMLGIIVLYVAIADGDGALATLDWRSISGAAGDLQGTPAVIAFVLIIAGLATKVGWAPVHNWLPDAHSEAPSLVSALLSGALLNCAFLGVLRGLQVCGMVGEAAFARELLLGFGLVSLAIAALFVLRQADFKRLLAYSSVEHMGLLAVGVGLAGAGGEAAMLHAVNHTVAKGMLFLLAGNLLAAFHTKEIHQVRGALRVLPVSGGLWLLGLFAITGTPPFGMFHSELALVRAALEQGRPVVAAGVLLGLGAVFAGMSAVFLRMCLGAPRGAVAAPAREEFSAILPPALLATLALWLGLQVPGELAALLRVAAAQLGALP